jgi:hypothetical protein
VLQLLPVTGVILKPRPGQVGVELFASEGAVHCAVSSTNMYGFYRFEDIEMMGERFSGGGDGRDSGGSGADPAPWLSVDTVVVEKIDFRTGKSLRFLRIEVPDRISLSEA